MEKQGQTQVTSSARSYKRMENGSQGENCVLGHLHKVSGGWMPHRVDISGKRDICNFQPFDSP